MNPSRLKIDKERTQRFELPTGTLAICLQPDGKRIFAACMDGVYEVESESKKVQRLYQHDSYVSGIALFRDTLISAGYDGTLQWFDLAASHVIRRIQAHSFWSWDLSLAREAPVVATVGGQYLAGSYRYEPKVADESTVKVYDCETGTLISEFGHLPPVQAVSVSGDGKFVAAGNLMGDAAVWEVGAEQVAAWNTPDFTGFGIIKSHCQVGGIYAAEFAPDGSLLVAGMGPMRDPMAGNGKQRWQQYAWSGEKPERLSSSNDSQMGEGLIETLCTHPAGKAFVMAGRLRGGNWNVGLFDFKSGELVSSLKSGTRVTQALFSADGSQLFLAGAVKQNGDPKRNFGMVDVYSVSEA